MARRILVAALIGIGADDAGVLRAHRHDHDR
jgi:hypothetical protein